VTAIESGLDLEVLLADAKGFQRSLNADKR
jgi:hypothetical protein